MADGSFDVAIVGSGLLSALLAGLLARDHGKRVVRVGRRPSAQRLPRRLDIALPLATRPQSWALLRQAETELRALLLSIGLPDAFGAVGVGIVADQPASIDGIAHIAHLVAACGTKVRRSESGAVEFKAISAFNSGVEPKLAAWLASLGVTEAEPCAATFLKTGAAQLDGIEAVQIVLADDAALLSLLPEAQRPPILLAEQMTATLTAPARRLSSPLLLFPDRGVTLAQREDGSVLALVSGERDVEARLASTLPGPFPLPRRASARYRRITTADGAPLVGRLKPSRLYVVAGLGHAEAFFAPAIARLLAGQRSEDEKRWFTDHDPSRLEARQPVADFVAAAFA